MFSDQLENIINRVEKDFGELNAVQLNWKPATDKWSIGQCLDHIINSNKQYIPIFTALTSGSYKNSFWEKVNPMSKYTGKKLVLAHNSDSGKKMKSPLQFSPSKKQIKQEIINDFIIQQRDLIKLFVELENEKYSEMIITSPLAGLITFPVKDALELIVVHEERHFLQAIRVMSESGFPK